MGKLTTPRVYVFRDYTMNPVSKLFNHKNSSLTFFNPKVEKRRFLGKAMDQFCTGLDIALLRESKTNNKEKLPKVRAKRQLRSRFRGQTQTQFMNFGNGNGSAEAVSKPDVSTAIVRKFKKCLRFIR